MRRTQIYLEDAQDRALTARARRLDRTKSDLIREAIDGYLSPDSAQDAGIARLREALAGAAGSIPSLPSGVDYVEQARASDRERANALDARRS